MPTNKPSWGRKLQGGSQEVHVELGDAVEVGDPMIMLDQHEFELQVIQAEAQLLQARAAVGLSEEDRPTELDPQNAPPVRMEKAVWDESKSSLERAQRLLGQFAVSQGEYDLALAAERAAEARHAAAINSVREKIALIGIREADLAVARQRLQDATIRAPIDGYVRTRQAAPGTFVQVGQPIATVVRTDPLRFRGAVPERYARSLSVGQEVRLQVVSVEDPRIATIIASVPHSMPTVDPSRSRRMFRIPNQLFRAGVFAEAEIVVDTRARALVIPHSALSEFAGVEKVWKVVDGVVTEQEVLAGPRRDEGREIVQGLSLGDQILRRAEEGRVARVTPGPQASEPATRNAVVTPGETSTGSAPEVAAESHG